MNKRFVFLSGGDIGVAVIIEAPTGIVYENQCAGTSCLHKQVEGYYVPLGHPFTVPTTANVISFFDRFHCTPPTRRNLWREKDLKELAAIISKIVFWKSKIESTLNDKMTYLTLDTDRLDDLTEAWIPVKTADGPGVLVFDNCD